MSVVICQALMRKLLLMICRSCKEVDADGVHLGVNDMSFWKREKYSANRRLIGATIHFDHEITQSIIDTLITSGWVHFENPIQKLILLQF